MIRDKLRHCIFRPYVRGAGPTFRLETWDTGRTDNRGCARIGYRLTMDKVPLFEGEDFCGSPLYAIDSDDSIKALMGFLTLRPGDTDSEYFDTYTPEQLEYCSHYAEALSCEVYSRFGE